MPRVSKYSIGLEGQRFNRWTVVSFSYSRPSGKKSIAFYWLCKCDCGQSKEVNARLLVRGKSSSCGCLKQKLNAVRTLTHGHNRSKTIGHSPEYRSWSHIIQRCDNPKHNKAWHRYGGRGIKVCQGIRQFSVFINMLGHKPTPQHSIDRVNNNGHYSCGLCPECVLNKWSFNLRWATPKEQAGNTCRSPQYSDS